MANSKISALTSATTPLAGTETVPAVQSSTTKQVSVANLTAGRAVSALSYAAGNLSIAGNAITSTSGTVNLRPASNGLVTFGAAANANWANTYTGFSGGGDIYSLSADGSASNSFGLASNAYRTASGTPGTWKYSATAQATLYVQDRQQHLFYTAVSGTANNTITWVPVISTSAAGNVTINTGNLVQGTAAKGVNFTANTPAAGMTSQLLSWYEEGTWTPVIADAATGGNTATATVLGNYTRVGNVVTVAFTTSSINTTGMTSGNSIYIRGLPFANKSNQYCYGTCDVRSIIFTTQPFMFINSSASYIRLFQNTSGGGVTSTLVSNLISGSASIFGSITYSV